MDWSEFRRAVKDNAEPTPSYLYHTLSQCTYADRGTQNQLVDALFDKLRPPATGQPTSVHVLCKSLHLIKVLCESGHPGFQERVQAPERSAILKNYASYHGRPDPMHGDALNERVRSEAKAALETAFSDRGSHRGDFSCGSGSASSFPAAGFSGHGSTEYSKASKADTSFTTGAKFTGGGGGSALSSAHAGSGPSFQPVGRIGEMPQENRWMDYAAELEAKRTTQPANTLFQQLSQKAKAGWNLIAEHEMMKCSEAGAHKSTTTRRSLTDVMVGDGGGSEKNPSVARFFDASALQVGGYQPVGVPTAPLGDGTGHGGTEFSAIGGSGDNYPPESISDGHEKRQTVNPAGASRFAFLNPPPADASGDANHAGSSPLFGGVSGSGVGESPLGTNEGNREILNTQPQQQPPHALPFRRVVQRLVTSSGAPQRVELAEFVAACLAEGEGRMAADGEGGGNSSRVADTAALMDFQEPQKSNAAFSFLDELGNGEAVAPRLPVSQQQQQQGTAASSSAAAVWFALAEALDEQLDPQQPWPQRLRALSGLEALLYRAQAPAAAGPLLGGAAPSSTTQASALTLAGCGGALRQHFTAKPVRIARCANVAQATLRDKATRVARMLNISTVLTAPRPPVDDSRQTSDLLFSSSAEKSGEMLNLSGMNIMGPRRRQQQQQQQTAGVPDISGPAGEGTAAVAHSAPLFTADDGSVLALRRRAPMQPATSGAVGVNRNVRQATTPPVAASNGGSSSSIVHPLTGQPHRDSALDDLFGGAAAPSAPTAPAPSMHASGLDDLFSATVPRVLVETPATLPRKGGETGAISVLGVRQASPSLAEADALQDPFAQQEQQQQQQPAYYGSDGSGHPMRTAAASSHFTTGGVASRNSAPGSVQSMNKAFAEMQRQLMAKQQPPL